MEDPMVDGVMDERRDARRRLSEGQGIRVERRSGEERRDEERRLKAEETEPERRQGPERRERQRRVGYDRRAILDRRRSTPAAYSRMEANQIRKMLEDPAHDLECPRCGGELTSSPVSRRGSLTRVWEIHCVPCHRILIMRDVAPPE
jgi:hypothetical protein